MLLYWLCMFAQLRASLTRLCVAFGTGKNYWMISAHGIYAALGEEKSLALPMFHAFTGCDTVSSFSGRGKKIAWETWNVFPEVTDAFQSLMRQPQQSDVENAMIVLERFVVLLYDKTSCRSHVNEVRVDLFAYKGRDVLHIPPTQGCLIEHVKRAAYCSHYYQWLSFHNQINGAGQELLKEHGKFFGANFLRQVKCAESSYAVVAQKAAERIANVKKLRCPAQLYASVLAHVSNHVNSILFHSIIIITICTHAYNSLYFIYV